MVNDGKVDVNKPITYLTAEEEDLKTIAQAGQDLDDKGNFKGDTVKCRNESDFPIVEPAKVQMMDVAPIKLHQ